MLFVDLQMHAIKEFLAFCFKGIFCKDFVENKFLFKNCHKMEMSYEKHFLHLSLSLFSINLLFLFALR